MFRMRKLRSVLALILCASALLMCLSGCVNKDDNVGPGTPPDEDRPVEDDKNDPAELLSSALSATKEDLEQRFVSSPLSGLTGITSDNAVTAEFDVSFPDEGGSAAGSVTGNAVLNTHSGEVLADCSMSANGIPFSVYYGPEFAGISSEELFGDGTLYGLRPYGLVDQLSGSALAELVKLDMDAVAELDGILNSIPKDVNVFTAPFMDKVFNATKDLVNGLSLKLTETAITRGGKEQSAYSLSASVPSDKLADYLKSLANALPEGLLLYGIGSGDGSAAAVDEALESIRQSGASTPITFTVSDGKLYHISAEYRTDEGAVQLEAELYGDNGKTVLVVAEPYFSVSIDLSDGVSMKAYTGSDVSLDWAPGGEFTLTASDGGTDLGLEGTFTADGGRLSYNGVWYTGGRDSALPLKFVTSPGGQVSAPENTSNLSELTSRQLYSILMKVILNIF